MSSYTNHIRWVATQSFFYILQHLITSPEGEKASKYSEGPRTGSLNGRETSEGWHTSCHWCHGSASHCFVRHNLTSLAVSLAFWPCQCWLLEWKRQDEQRQMHKDPYSERWTSTEWLFLAQFVQINRITAGLFALLLQLILIPQMNEPWIPAARFLFLHIHHLDGFPVSSVEQTARLWHSLCVDKAENTAVTQSAWFRDVL